VGSNGLIQTAATNIPRFDHTSAGVCRGLLIEESRTNLFQRSDDFGNAYWTKLRSTITSDATTSPSGSTDADKLVEDTSTNSHIVYRLVSVGVTTPVSFSVFAKASERSWIQLECGDNFTAGSTAYFNLSNGTIGTVGAGATASIQSMGNGWYRCVVVATPTATTGNGFYINIATANGTRFYAGDGTSGVFLWGAQLEAGSFPTSYIPTVASSVVRSADVCSITGANFTSFWNANEGAMLASGDPRGGASSATLVMANSGANANQVTFDRSTTTIKFGIANSGTYTATIQQNSTNGSFVKISGAYATNNARSALNGVLGTPDTSVIVPTNLNRFNIGSSNTANSELTNGCISEIKYFRKPLSNAKLQSLTV
jgi:hypothetical protein